MHFCFAQRQNTFIHFGCSVLWFISLAVIKQHLLVCPWDHFSQCLYNTKPVQGQVVKGECWPSKLSSNLQHESWARWLFLHFNRPSQKEVSNTCTRGWHWIVIHVILNGSSLTMQEESLKSRFEAVYSRHQADVTLGKHSERSVFFSFLIRRAILMTKIANTPLR